MTHHRPHNIPKPLLFWVFLCGLCAACLLGAACDDPPTPNASAQSLLKRRNQAQTLRRIADDAAAHNDLAAALSAYNLLIELWPDLPEARPGGAWTNEQQRLSAQIQRQATLNTALLRGQKLQAQLLHHNLNLSQMQRSILNILTPTTHDPFLSPTTPAEAPTEIPK